MTTGMSAPPIAMVRVTPITPDRGAGGPSMAARQHQRVRTEITVELAIGNQRPSEGHTSDESSQEGGGLDHGGSRVSGEAREMVDVGGHAGQHGGHADQGVEGSHQLGQVGDLDPLSDGCSNTSSGHGSSNHLSEDLRVGLDDAEGGGNTRADSDNTESVTKPGSWLGGQTSQSSDAAKS